MSRKHTKLSPSAARAFFDSIPTQWAHKGYLIRLNHLQSLYTISRDGFHICYANSLTEAREQIDMLVTP